MDSKLNPSLEKALNKVLEAIERQRQAVEALYYAAYWSADRPVNEEALWTELRDAFRLPPGRTMEVLGPRRPTSACACDVIQPL